jgi:hypothetical protein
MKKILLGQGSARDKRWEIAVFYPPRIALKERADKKNPGATGERGGMALNPLLFDQTLARSVGQRRRLSTVPS